VISRVITGLDHVQVAVPAGSEDGLRAFYSGVLGLPEVAKPPTLAARGGVWFQAGAAQLHCGVEPEFRPARKAHPAFAVAGVAALENLAARCVEAGHPVTWADDVPRIRRFHVADPVGNRLELQTPV
jgi:catechol 2,3-dioxygenase-like lactoylglutathione lyase family enzyme